MSNKKSEIFRYKIYTICGIADGYDERPKDNYIRFTTDSEIDLFPIAAKLRELLRTDNIKISGATQEEGCCDTCSYTKGVLEFTCRGVKFED